MICTIYLLTNKINNKIYVGQTWSVLKNRMGRDGKGYSNSTYLYYAIQKYGANNFEYKMLAFCEDQLSADKAEAVYIIIYDSKNHKIGYNIKDGGSAGKHSEDTKVKISNNNACYWKGKSISDATKLKLSEAMSGRELTPEHKAKVIETLQSGAFKDHHHSEESKDKISKSNTGRKLSPESVAKSAAARMMDATREQDILQAYKDGKIISEIEIMFKTGRSSIYRILKRNNIVRERENKSWIGKEHSEETKLKMSDSRKKYWDEKKV